MSRYEKRGDMSIEKRMMLAEFDLDFWENAVERLSKQLGRLTAVGIGIMVTLTTTSVGLFANLK